MACSVRRVKSDSLWYEAETEVGNGLNCCTRLHKKLTERNFVNMSGSLQFSRKGLKPGFEATFGTYLDKQTMGYLRYSTSMGLVSLSNDKVTQITDTCSECLRPRTAWC